MILKSRWRVERKIIHSFRLDVLEMYYEFYDLKIQKYYLGLDKPEFF